jgi:hypothetical protein
MNALRRILTIALAALVLLAPVRASEHDVPQQFAFTQAELDAMLAPIALYPDSLLSQILMASTYPLEVVEAARWSRDNPGLEGEAAVDAVADRDWDPSVKALVAFPRVLERMDEDLEWTRDLGDAFLAQEDEVLDSVQGLRRRADEAGSLDEVEHVVVEREREVIYIEPANPRVVYVPWYDPWVIYGSWWWPGYAPVVWLAPGFHFGFTHFYWGPSIHISPLFYYSRFDWHRHHVVTLDIHASFPTYVTTHSTLRSGDFSDAKPWRHDPSHRLGVSYRDPVRQQRYERKRVDLIESRIAAERRGERQRGAEPERRTEQRVERQRGAEPERRTEQRIERQRGAQPERRTERRVERQRGAEPERRTEQRIERQRGTQPERRTEQRVERQRGAEPERRTEQRIERQRGAQPERRTERRDDGDRVRNDTVRPRADRGGNIRRETRDAPSASRVERRLAAPGNSRERAPVSERAVERRGAPADAARRSAPDRGRTAVTRSERERPQAAAPRQAAPTRRTDQGVASAPARRPSVRNERRAEPPEDSSGRQAWRGYDQRAEVVPRDDRGRGSRPSRGGGFGSRRD